MALEDIHNYVKISDHLSTSGQIAYDEIMIDQDHGAMREFAEVTNNARTVPQIIIDGKCIGGFSELTELHMDGDLDDLMQDD